MEIIWIVSLVCSLGGYYVGHRIGYRSGAYDALLLNSYDKELAAEPQDLLEAKSRIEEQKDIERILWKIKQQ